jgi:hypothetical protein
MFKSFQSCGIGFSVQVLVSDCRKLEVLVSVSVVGLQRPLSQNRKLLKQQYKVKCQLKDKDEILNRKELFSLRLLLLPISLTSVYLRVARHFTMPLIKMGPLKTFTSTHSFLFYS